MNRHKYLGHGYKCKECKNSQARQLPKNPRRVQSIEEQKRRRKIRRRRWWNELAADRKTAIYKANGNGVRNNPDAILKARIRRAIRKALNRIAITQKQKVPRGTFCMLGFSAETLCLHLAFWLGKDCEECKETKITLATAHIDHKIPMAKAVTINEVINLNQLSNLRLICDRCNIRKGSKVFISESEVLR